jgi:putative ABC transport system permease protein
MGDSLSFIFSNSFRSKRRTLLTIASIAVSLCLLAILMTLYRALFLAPDPIPGEALRLIVHHKVSLTQELPLSYEEKIEQIPGVRAVTSLRWFGGVYKDARDPKNQFARFGIEPARFFNVHPEITMPQEQILAFQKQKTACIASRSLAEKLGWKMGERITIVGDMLPVNLELTLAGIFDQPVESNVLYFNRDYLQDSLPAGDAHRDMVQQYYVETASKQDVSRVAPAIDATFAESSAPTMTENEHAFMLGFVSFVGNVKLFLLAISGAVTFTILLVSANTISMSVRERVREVGILKTLGFSSSDVLGMIVGESAVIGVIGGAIGCIIAFLLCSLIAQAIRHGPPYIQELRSFAMTPLTTLLTIFAGILISAMSALVPAFSAARMPIVKSLRHSG